VEDNRGSPGKKNMEATPIKSTAETKIWQDFGLLLRPRWQASRNRLRRQNRDARVKLCIMALLGVAFWMGSFAIIYRVLSYFQRTEGFGDILAARLLNMIFLTFFFVLVFSNIITSMATYFMAQDLPVILSTPASRWSVYLGRFTETVLDSSWMVLLFGFPIFLAYGMVYKASIWFGFAVMGAVVPFLIIPAAIGVTLTMVLVNIFPAHKTRDIIILLSAMALGFFLLLIRLLRPERLVNPEATTSLVEYLSIMRTPTSPFLPSQWATEFIWTTMKGAPAEAIFPGLLLWSTALAFVIIGGWVFYFLYERGWSKAQESGRTRLSRLRIFDKMLNWSTIFFVPSMRNLIIKDIKTFFRDNAQWSQAVILFAMVGIYLYNFSVLPLDKTPYPTFFLQNLVSFLNMGLAGFVLSAISVRYIFPAISIEGLSFWIVRSAPITLREFLISKFLIGLVPLLIMAELLIVCSNYMLKATPFMMALSTTTMFLMTFGIVALGVGLGAVYPRFNAENVSQISSGFGGIVYMIISMAFIALVIVLEARPVYVIFMARLNRITLTPWEWTWTLFPFLIVILVMILAVVLPLRIGLKRMSEMEL